MNKERFKTSISNVLDALISEGAAQNIAVCVGQNDRVFEEFYRSKNGEIDASTKFDMASVTKILATTSLRLIAIEQGKLHLSDTFSMFFDCPEDKKDITVRNLLTHTIGIGHKPLDRAPNTYENIATEILRIPLDIPVGSDVLYSCPAFILLGKILEKLYENRLDALFYEMVALPLGMKDTSFLPKGGTFVNSNMEDWDIGTVNDCNCRFLGGIAGNAGVFSTMHDMKLYAKALSNGLSPLISRDTFNLAIQNHTPHMSESRGLGFVIVDERHFQTGTLFDCGAIGHCGHTGQSVFVDERTGLYAIILSDMTLSTQKAYGSERYENVKANRQRIHNALFAALTQANKI